MAWRRFAVIQRFGAFEIRFRVMASVKRVVRANVVSRWRFTRRFSKWASTWFEVVGQVDIYVARSGVLVRYGARVLISLDRRCAEIRRVPVL